MMKDKEAKERMAAWKALPEPRISWEAFKRQWQRKKANENQKRNGR